MRRLFGKSQKRLVRYGLLAANVAVLVGVTMFITSSQSSGEVARQGATGITAPDEATTSPLDQLSSADIAAHVARLTDLPEARSVDNHADSFNAQLSTAAVSGETIVAKPQVVSTAQKSRKDITKYVVKSGETITSIAQKFGITSDSIRWSNGITGDTVAAGKELTIPPISGIIYTVKSGDTVDSIAQRYNANKEAVAEFNDAEIAGIKQGEQIVIPNGIQPVVRSSYASGSFAWGGFTAVYSSNGYDYGWCTWWAAKRRADTGRPIPSNLGNAYTWASNAQRAGIAVNGTPSAGAVAWYGSIGGLGHVGYVEQVNPDGSIWISDMNYFGVSQINGSAPAGGWGRTSYHLVPATGLGSYKFIH